MIRILYAAALLFATFSTSSVQADILMFDLAWSGASFGNSATATGSITIDDTQLPNPGGSGAQAPFQSIGVVDFTITVMGARNGNGTFTLANFRTVRWDSGNLETATLDLTTELVGQPTGAASWGTPSAPGSFQTTGGDFNVFSSSLAPTGVAPFQIATFGGVGDTLLLTNFTPVASPTVTLGDANQDGNVDFLDISAFISILSVNDFLPEADINGDQVVDFLDIGPFIALLPST